MLLSTSKKNAPSINPFVTDYVETLDPDPCTSVKIRIDYRGSSIEKFVTELISSDITKQQGSVTKEKLHNWAHINTDLISKMPNNQVKNKKMQENLCRVLKDDIKRFNLFQDIAEAVIKDAIIDPIDEFISWLIKNPLLISSMVFPYYTQHFMHKNVTMEWKKSHIDDLSHLAALPYVSYLSVDNQIKSYALEALKYSEHHMPDNWRTKLITSVSEIK